MNISSAAAIIFSPTGNTRKVTDSVLKGIGVTKTRYIDLTNKIIRDNPVTANINEEFILIGSPVYGGGIPPVIIPFLEKLNGQHKTAILLTTYGNMSDGLTIYELYRIAVKNGFKVLGLGSFIGEHSYSTKDNYVAAGRPNTADLIKAEEFGKAIKQKLQVNNMSSNTFKLRISYKLFAILRKNVKMNSARFYAKVPTLDMNLCTHCGLCVTLCPVNAIEQETLKAYENKCIRCCSCIKNCPYDARSHSFRLNIPVDSLLAFLGKKPKDPKFFL